MKKLRWRERPFRIQILIVYLISLALVLTAVLFTYFGVIGSYARRELDSNLQTEWEKVKNALDTSVEKVAEYSKIIGEVDEVQAFLKYSSGMSGKQELERSDALRIILENSDVSSIFVCSLEDYYYALPEGRLMQLEGQSVQDASWFETVRIKQGNYSLYLNGGGFFPAEENCLSVISLVRDSSDLTPLGVLVCNMNLRTILRALRSRNVLQWVTDGLGNPLYTSEETLDLTGKEEYIRIYGPAAFTVHVALDRASVQSNYRIYYYTLAVIFLVMLAILLLSTQVLSTSVTKPLRHVLKAMESDRLESIVPVRTNREMTQLQIGYNKRTERIAALMGQQEAQQKQQRRYELQVLNAQIRPHFLYNTFDSVSALALMGKTKDVYRLMQALGKYYRTSLHKGDEIISLREELDIIRNYVIIQKYRFEDIFEVTYDVDPSLLELPVLKLILQPLVENAIYHGIKPKGEGVIRLSARLEERDLLLTVWDSGKGISEQKIEHILHGKVDEEEKSFGVYGTIERISLHYGIEAPIEIESVEGSYTSLTIRLPKVKD